MHCPSFGPSFGQSPSSGQNPSFGQNPNSGQSPSFGPNPGLGPSFGQVAHKSDKDYPEPKPDNLYQVNH